MIIVSYPKSGRTWLRVMIKQYSKVTNQRYEPDEHQWTHIGYGYGRVILPQHVRKYEGTKVLLQRDPLDTIVSFYHDESARRPHLVRGDIDDYAKKKVHHYNKYTREIKTLDFDISLSYERMLTDTYKEVLPIFHALFGAVESKSLQDTIEFCKFDNLYDLERKGEMEMRANSTFFKTRKGKVGSAQEELSPETIKYLGENLL